MLKSKQPGHADNTEEHLRLEPLAIEDDRSEPSSSVDAAPGEQEELALYALDTAYGGHLPDAKRLKTLHSEWSATQRYRSAPSSSAGAKMASPGERQQPAPHALDAVALTALNLAAECELDAVDLRQKAAQYKQAARRQLARCELAAGAVRQLAQHKPPAAALRGLAARALAARKLAVWHELTARALGEQVAQNELVAGAMRQLVAENESADAKLLSLSDINEGQLR
ncbi:hypothetical protein AB1Y20_012279 [Prymnesium parvum]|uniref:Uncharacterized protein n=1 Tax=Prymnesium parvum TaxID=97485 RepID=A0AB34IP18_PRYPA